MIEESKSLNSSRRLSNVRIYLSAFRRTSHESYYQIESKINPRLFRCLTVWAALPEAESLRRRVLYSILTFAPPPRVSSALLKWQEPEGARKLIPPLKSPDSILTA